MLIRKTYLDLPAAQRREAAKAARARYQGMLSSSGSVLTAEQRAAIHAQLRHLASWEAGTIPVNDGQPKKAG